MNTITATETVGLPLLRVNRSADHPAIEQCDDRFGRLYCRDARPATGDRCLTWAGSGVHRAAIVAQRAIRLSGWTLRRAWSSMRTNLVEKAV